MQPYQSASQEIARQGERPVKIAQNIASTATSLYSGGLAFSKVLPFLSQYIPEDLARKGLSKIDPRFGKFIDKAIGEGKSFDEIKEFISGKAEESKKASQPDGKNIITQESPELFQFIQEWIDKGWQPIQAGNFAAKSKKFYDIVKKLEKVHKVPFGDIVQSIFGQGNAVDPNMASNGQIDQNNPQQAPIQQNPQMQQGQQQPQGNGDQALLAAMQKILNM